MKYTVEIDNQNFVVEVEDIHARPVVAIVDGERFNVWPETGDDSAQQKSLSPTISVPEPDQGLRALEPTGDTAASQQVLSPLPGVIVTIPVEPGDTVTRGQELCTLEAMKMKNAIRSARDGTIDSVDVSVGDQVSHGQVLMTFED